MLLSFEAQLLAQKPGEFTSKEGSNKGVTYGWTELHFNTKEGSDLVLKTVAPVEVAPEMMRRDLAWVLEVEPRKKGNVTTFKVVRISGTKAK